MRGIDEPWNAAPELSAACAREWALTWPQWFGPTRVPLPRAPERADLCLRATEIGTVVAKRLSAAGWRVPLIALGARPPRAERAFHAAQSLLRCGLATPAPLAVLGRPRDCVLVTRYVEGEDPWERLARSQASAPLLAALAQGLARLHAAGFRNRDCKASNLLLRGPDAAPELVWTDLDGLRALGTVEPRLRARDLARLGASFASARARAAGVRQDHWPELVRSYLCQALGHAPEPAELSRLLRWTRAWSERTIRRHLARGVPVH